MVKSSRTSQTSHGVKLAVLCLALAALAPLVVTLGLILYITIRYRGAGRLAPLHIEFKARTAGVKTMAEVMEAVRQIPFRPLISRGLASFALFLRDLVPVTLNTNRLTSGIVYPYPEVFEPVIMESGDGTPVCGVLAIQPGGERRPALILVHGLFSSKNTYLILSLALKAYCDWGFHVFALDLRNFGDSSRFSEAPTSWGYRESEDILAAAEYLNSLDRVTTVGVFGCSMGASSSLLAASRSRLDRPISGGVVAVSGHADARRIVDHISTISRPLAERFVNWLVFHLALLVKTAMEGPRPMADFRRYTREVSSQYYEMSDEELYTCASPVNFMEKIEVPCLIIHAKDDTIVPIEEADELYGAASGNPMVDLVVTPKGGHGLHQAVCPKWFYETLETFFLYWGEFGLGPEGYQTDFDRMDILGNPDN